MLGVASRGELAKGYLVDIKVFVFVLTVLKECSVLSVFLCLYIVSLFDRLLLFCDSFFLFMIFFIKKICLKFTINKYNL